MALILNELEYKFTIINKMSSFYKKYNYLFEEAGDVRQIYTIKTIPHYSSMLTCAATRILTRFKALTPL